MTEAPADCAGALPRLSRPLQASLLLAELANPGRERRLHTAGDRCHRTARHQRLVSAIAGRGQSHEEAIAKLTRVIDLSPKYAWAIAERGEAYRLMSRYEEALDDFARHRARQ